MAKDVPRAVIRIGFGAEYRDEGRGIFVFRPSRHCPPDLTQDHRTTER
jgi:hypothetical protein